jgi:hypothetical protein
LGRLRLQSGGDIADTGGMTRFQTSWEIAKRSWAVLKSDKTLAWFPVLSFLASIAVFAVFAGLVAAIGLDSGATKDSLQPVGWVLIALGYVGLAFVQTYFLAGLVAGADVRLHGGNSTVKGALQVANSRLHRLLPWALVSATVTVIINQLERQGIIGQIIGSLVGLAWSLVTFLTIPILVIEDIGVGSALKRSKDLFKKTWGENVVGQAGLGIVGFVAMIPGFLVIALGVATGSVVVAVVIGAIGVAWILVASTVVAALSGIYRTALYRFASTGEVPEDFTGVDFQGAFRPRRINPRGMFGGGNGGINPN